MVHHSKKERNYGSSSKNSLYFAFPVAPWNLSSQKTSSPFLAWANTPCNNHPTYSQSPYLFTVPEGHGYPLVLYINSLRHWRSSGFRLTGPDANRRAEFPVPSLWAKLLEEIRLRHSSAERRPGIADVKNGVPGRVRSGLCVTKLGNFCSREHPLREVISSHFSESFWYGRCWFWVL